MWGGLTRHVGKDHEVCLEHSHWLAWCQYWMIIGSWEFVPSLYGKAREWPMSHILTYATQQPHISLWHSSSMNESSVNLATTTLFWNLYNLCIKRIFLSNTKILQHINSLKLNNPLFSLANYTHKEWAMSRSAGSPCSLGVCPRFLVDKERLMKEICREQQTPM